MQKETAEQRKKGTEVWKFISIRKKTQVKLYTGPWLLLFSYLLLSPRLSLKGKT